MCTIRDDALPAWAYSHTVWFVSMGLSLLVSVIGILLVPHLCVRLPDDFLVGAPTQASFMRRALRTAAGAFFVALGIALLVLPGPGIVSILVGLSLAEFPGKRRILRWFLARPRVLSAVNALRTKNGKPPLMAPSEDAK
jgi:hypothetical protein